MSRGRRAGWDVGCLVTGARQELGVDTHPQPLPPSLMALTCGGRSGGGGRGSYWRGGAGHPPPQGLLTMACHARPLPQAIHCRDLPAKDCQVPQTEMSRPRVGEQQPAEPSPSLGNLLPWGPWARCRVASAPAVTAHTNKAPLTPAGPNVWPSPIAVPPRDSPCGQWRRRQGHASSKTMQSSRTAPWI